MSADAHSALRDEFGSTAASFIRPPIQANPRLLSQQPLLPEISSTPLKENLSSVNRSDTVSFPSRYPALSQPTTQEAASLSTDVVTPLFSKLQAQVQRLLADQITPLRLAGHLSVLVVAAIILLLSQVHLPEWNLALDSLPNNVLAGQLQGNGNAPVARLLTNELNGDSGNFESLQRVALPFTIVPERPREEVEVYTVQSGDTVLGIAAQYGLQPETVLWANSQLEQNPDRISIGDTLKILPINGVLHVVKPGDTLSSIASKYKVTANDIVAYAGNNLADANAALVVGTEVIVPGGQKPVVAQQVVAYGGPVPANAARGSGAFVWPTSGTITQKYWNGHAAIDIGAWTGAPVKASDGGYVIVAGRGWNSGYGNHVIIDHGNGYTTVYAHLNSIFVSPGENVAKGQQIGTVGNTGNSTGPHLHFEIRYQGIRRNPQSYLP